MVLGLIRTASNTRLLHHPHIGEIAVAPLVIESVTDDKFIVYIEGFEISLALTSTLFPFVQEHAVTYFHSSELEQRV